MNVWQCHLRESAYNIYVAIQINVDVLYYLIPFMFVHGQSGVFTNKNYYFGLYSHFTCIDISLWN